MEFNTKIALPETFKADCVAVGVFDEGGLTPSARRIDGITRGALRAALASGDISGARGTSLLLRAVPGVASSRVLLVGLGKPDEFGDRVTTQQEIEVSSTVRLQHVIDVHAGVAARLAYAGWRLPRRSPTGKLVVRYFELESALGHVEPATSVGRADLRLSTSGEGGRCARSHT